MFTKLQYGISFMLLVFASYALQAQSSIDTVAAWKSVKQYATNHQYDSASQVLNSLISNFRQLKENAAAYHTAEYAGNMLLNQGNYDKALKYFIQTEELSKILVDCKYAMSTKLNFARVSYGMNEKTAAIKQLQLLLPQLNACNDSVILFRTYYYFGVIYYEIGENDSARAMLEKGLTLRSPELSDKDLSKAYSVLGEIIWVRFNEPLNGLRYFFKAKDIAEKSGDLYARAFANLKLGSYYVDEGTYAQSLPYLLQAKQQFDSIGGIPDRIYIMRLLAHLYGKNNMPEETYKTYDSILVLQYKLFNEEMIQDVADLKTKYETQKKIDENLQLTLSNAQKDLDISKAKQQNQLFLIAFILVVGTSAAIWLRLRSRENARKRNALLEQERITLRAMLEGEEKERMRLAKELHDGLGQILSVTRLHVNALEGLQEMESENQRNQALNLIDEAVREVRQISHDLMPATLMQLGLTAALKQLSNRINETGFMQVELQLDENLKQLSNAIEIAVYRIIQEILNNIIKHAGAEKVTLQLKESETLLHLTVKDNGKGFDTTHINQPKGIGWLNIMSRVNLLNGEFNVTSEIDKGTTIHISIPTFGNNTNIHS